MSFLCQCSAQTQVVAAEASGPGGFWYTDDAASFSMCIWTFANVCVYIYVRMYIIYNICTYNVIYDFYMCIIYIYT